LGKDGIERLEEFPRLQSRRLARTRFDGDLDLRAVERENLDGRLKLYVSTATGSMSRCSSRG